MSNVATILLTMAQQALAAATGALFAQRIEFRAYLDHFGVNHRSSIETRDSAEQAEAGWKTR